ncbi:transmembrane protein 45B-like isoform X1 [Palaemon carinicauda]|uniref:transmembrane protein 45B-like isoform X1 n=1 Tax=Palaemon carinicauda TaxID=392227 RepID=UPI0035B6791E
MGTFLGHVLPGSFFILYASWLMFHVFTKYFLGQRAVAGTTTRENGSSPTSYKSTCAHVFPCCPRIPLEGVFKIVLTLIGFLGELITGFEDGVFVHYGNAQHMTMYSFFGMSGAFDILVFRGLRAPPNLDYITLIIAFAIEALLFGYHLHGRTPLDIQVHMFMLYAIIFCAVATAIEMMYKRKVLPALMRVYFVMLQGTWFIQVGSILYMPLTTPWDENSHTHMMLATVLFCCHIGGVFLLMASVGWILSRRVKKMLSTSVYCQLGRRTDKSKMTQAEALDALGDSEEEV